MNHNYLWVFANLSCHLEQTCIWAEVSVFLLNRWESQAAHPPARVQWEPKEHGAVPEVCGRPWAQDRPHHATSTLWGSLGKGVPHARLQTKSPELSCWRICQCLFTSSPRLWDWCPWPVDPHAEGQAGRFILLIRWTTLITKGKWVFVLPSMAFDREESVFPAFAAPLLARHTRSRTGTESSGRRGSLVRENQVWLLIYKMGSRQSTKIPR